MSAATLLLADKKCNRTDIFAKLGYSSLEHFSTAFKKFYGRTTSDYRKSNPRTTRHI